mmetsp:Transcript_20562/g.31436  ORF Transcript_20562/g.31436 Transcript_20562/m.31436 type:complete len:405 (+) Transcript_20562:185-1399(+)
MADVGKNNKNNTGSNKAQDHYDEDDDDEAPSELKSEEMTAPKIVKISRRYSYLVSTETNWKSNDMKFYGPYADIRAKLDYNYHCNYTKERQQFQDIIIQKMSHAVIRDKDGWVGTTPTEPWIVFTAGAMGAGKGHTVNQLKDNGRFPLVSFITVDPDEIRREFPEFLKYVDTCPHLAGDLTMKEAGYVAEILTIDTLNKGKNCLVDGSLRDFVWYKSYFELLRRDYPKLRLGIMHVMAPREAVFARAKERAKITGRVVPEKTIEMSLQQVPRSVKVLGPLADYFAEIMNAPNTEDVELVTPKNSSWDEFAQQWKQTLSFKPGHIRKRFSKLDDTVQAKISQSKLSRESVYNFSSELEGALLDIDDDDDSSTSDAGASVDGEEHENEEADDPIAKVLEENNHSHL